MSNRAALRLVALFLVVAGGVVLRARELNGRALWQDEAESAIYALQILDVGYPHDTFNGERLFETRSFLPDPDSDRYEFQSTNFIGSRYEKNKGWLPYYLMAGSFRLFGVGAWQARLPSVLLSGVTMALVYALARMLLPPSAALLVSLVHAVNYLAWIHERQARYYSLVMLAAALAFLCWGRWRQRGDLRWLWAAAGSLVLLFHTHAPAAAVFGVLFVLDQWRAAGGWQWVRRRSILAAAAAAAALTVPWLAWVNAPAVWRYGGSDPQGFRLRWILLLGVAAAAAVVLWRLWHWLGGRFPALPPRLRWWLGVSAAYAAVMPLLVPADSVAERLLLPLVPLLEVAGVTLAMRLVSPSRRAADWLVVGLFASIVIGGLGILHANSLRRAAPYTVEWIAPVAAELVAARPALVVSDYHQFSLAFATGLPTQLLSVLRCEYLRQFPGSVVYVRHPVMVAGRAVVALPYCNTGEIACIERVQERVGCLTANRPCAQSEVAGTHLLSCRAPVPL